MLVAAGAAALGLARGQETLPLDATIASAPPGQAHGHAFARLVDLDPAIRYLGGALITEDVCIRGHGATIDLGGDFIQVLAGGGPTRLDIDHCLILYGEHPGLGSYGGGLAYGAGTKGWVENNTFYGNVPSALYLDVVVLDETRVVNNLFFGNAGWGFVRNENQQNLHVRYNDSFRNAAGQFGVHCACPFTEPEPIYPGGLDGELHFSNFSADPMIVAEPAPPKVAGDFHLREGSPCIGAGEGGLDVGALPYESPPAALPCGWGALKGLFR